MNKKEEIIELLKKKENPISESAIAGALGINKYYAERYLNELKAEKRVISIKKGSYTLWGVKKLK